MPLSSWVAILLFLPVSLPAEDSPGFRGSSEHTGVYDTVPLAKFSQLKWKFKTKGLVLSSPAGVNVTLFAGSADHNLNVIDIATGSQKWIFKTGSGVPSSPAVAQGIVYFVSHDGNLYAVDAATGQLRWKFQTAGEHRFTATHLHGAQPAAESMPDPFDVYLSSPLVAQNSVFFGSGDGNIYSLDAATGKLNWKFHTGDVVHASPVIWAGKLYIGSWDSCLYALDAAAGRQLWRFKTGEDRIFTTRLACSHPP